MPRTSSAMDTRRATCHRCSDRTIAEVIHVLRKTTKKRTSDASPFRLRRSAVHGRGVFAARPIAKGERISEYAGERISHEEAERRHENKADEDNHTFLFTVDAKVVIDGGVGGNDARFINHACDPNCEVVAVRGRLVVEAIRAIDAGEELGYDYNLNRSPDDAPDVERIFACLCGSPRCRGTMLAPRKTPRVVKKRASGSRARPTRSA